MPRADYRLAGLALAGTMLASCTGGGGNFTTMQGFDEIRALQGSDLPTAAERALLERHRPRLFVAAGQEGPVDFYRDYITQGCLVTTANPTADCAVDQPALNAARDDLDAVFTHEPATAPPHPVGYGSVYRGTVVLPGLEPEARGWTFLRYHFAFRHSGIAAGVDRWQGFLLGLVGDLDDWHQLDHYTAVVVALDETDAAVAVMLQQHNYMHTYIIGADPAFPAPGDYAVDVARRSNEFYPHRPAPARHRAASFISADVLPWIAAGEDAKPMMGTHDLTAPDREVDYDLLFLRPDDAFYTFRGRLGAHRSFQGRDGPPGAIYYTVPSLWRYEVSLPFFYWRSPDPGYVAAMDGFDPFSAAPDLAAHRQRFTQALVEQGLVR